MHLWSSSTTPRVVAHTRTVVHLKHPAAQVGSGECSGYCCYHMVQAGAMNTHPGEEPNLAHVVVESGNTHVYS
jgi:hypothetical protein